MAKFAQYYLKYNWEHIFSAEYKDWRQQIFGVFSLKTTASSLPWAKGKTGRGTSGSHTKKSGSMTQKK